MPGTAGALVMSLSAVPMKLPWPEVWSGSLVMTGELGTLTVAMRKFPWLGFWAVLWEMVEAPVELSVGR